MNLWEVLGNAGLLVAGLLALVLYVLMVRDR